MPFCGQYLCWKKNAGKKKPAVLHNRCCGYAGGFPHCASFQVQNRMVEVSGVVPAKRLPSEGEQDIDAVMAQLESAMRRSHC